MSSVAGDTSDASAAIHGLKSIYEHDGDAVKGTRGNTGGNTDCLMLYYNE